jgi:hypothetical protein
MASFVFRLAVLISAPALGICAEANHSWDVLMQTLQPGRTVVVTRTNSATVEGKLLELGPNSLTVQRHGQPQIVRREDTFRVRIANIRRKHTLIGMAVGTGAGVVIGASSDRYRGISASIGALMGLGFGALGGGVLPIGKPLYEAPKPPKPALTGGKRE